MRGSVHCQYVPQVGLPQIAPVASATNVNDAPIGAMLTAAACASFRRQMKPMAAATARSRTPSC